MRSRAFRLPGQDPGFSISGCIISAKIEEVFVGDIAMVVIAVALVWIVWELTRIADFVHGFVANDKIKGD